MCSKTSNGDREYDYSVLSPKKQKHNGSRKVPRRGPGVAELEKIRLEEQHVSPPAPLPPPPEKSPSAILPTTTNKTGPVYPFLSYFTTGSFPNDLIPPAPVFQRKHDPSLHHLPPMNPPNPGSRGFYQFMEPPSNQTSCFNNVSRFLDEEKILAKRRPCHFFTETAICSVEPTITISKDGKHIRLLDQRLKSQIQDPGTTIRNSITIDSPSPSPSTPTPLDFPRFIQKEEFDHEFMPRRSSAKISSNKKPFYSFLEPSNEESIGDQDRSLSFKPERYDTVTDHGIDLSLKL